MSGYSISLGGEKMTVEPRVIDEAPYPMASNYQRKGKGDKAKARKEPRNFERFRKGWSR